MTDEQLHKRMINKRMIAVAILFLLMSAGLLYYRFSTQADVDTYFYQKSQETSLRSQVQALESTNNSLLSTIEQTGKELVSFSEDKIKYINLASELSEKYSLNIDKLTVSDVWQEGQMSGMTTSIEVQGSLYSIKEFINDYCSTKYTNRINVVSFRPVDRYPWITRGLDDEKVIDWFDLSEEERLYTDKMREEVEELQRAATEAGLLPSDVGLGLPSDAQKSELENAANLNGVTAPEEITTPEGTAEQQPSQNFGDSGEISATAVSNAPPSDNGTDVRETNSVETGEGDDEGFFDVNGSLNPYSGISTYEANEKEPITLSLMFTPKTYKIYLEIDFLGRQ